MARCPSLPCPVESEVLPREAGLLTGWPAEVAARWTQDLHPAARLIRGQDVGGDIARIDELALR